MKLWNFVNELHSDAYDWVELSHECNENTPHYHFFKPMNREITLNADEHKFNAEYYTLASQYGTHVDSPYHMHNGGKSLEAIPCKEMFLPLVVIDVSEKVKQNVDYGMSVDDVLEFEAKYGKIPANSFVAMRTDWSKKPDNEISGLRSDGTYRTPGWLKSTVEFLVEQRKITAIGHETTDSDPSVVVAKGDWPSEYYILEVGKYQVELLKNLDKVPPVGSIIVLGWPRLTNAAGFTCRAYAIVPG